MKKTDRFFRVGEWSTDGYFMIKTNLEKHYMKKWPSAESHPTLGSVNHILSGCEDFYKPVHTIKSSDLMLDRKTLELTDFDKAITVTIDAKFRELFPSDCPMFIKDNSSPVVLRSSEGNEIIGLIMPARLG